MTHLKSKSRFNSLFILVGTLLFFGISMGQGFAAEPMNQREKDEKYQQWEQLRTEAILALRYNKYTKCRVALETALEVAQTYLSQDQAPNQKHPSFIHLLQKNL